MFFHVCACVYMLHSRTQLTSTKQLHGSFTTHLICAVQCHSGCPVQSISTMVQSLYLSNSPSVSSFSFSTITSYPILCPSYSFLILCHLGLYTSSLPISHLSPVPPTILNHPNLTEPWLIGQLLHRENTAPQNAFHYINMHYAYSSVLKLQQEGVFTKLICYSKQC